METASVKYLGGLHDPLKVISEDENGVVREPDVYRGFDESGHAASFEAGGDPVEVSQAMADRLADEFPGFFAIDGKAGEKKKRGKKADQPNSDEMRAQLLERDRGELDAVAAELGIDDPAGVASVEELVDAIIAKHAEQ